MTRALIYFLAAVALTVVVTAAYAVCTNTVVTVDGRTLVCITCCSGGDNCITTCN